MTADSPATCNIAGGHFLRLRAAALALRGPAATVRSHSLRSAVRFARYLITLDSQCSQISEHRLQETGSRFDAFCLRGSTLEGRNAWSANEEVTVELRRYEFSKQIESHPAATHIRTPRFRVGFPRERVDHLQLIRVCLC